MFVLFRAVVYASAFIFFLLIFIPSRLLENTGISRSSGIADAAGMVLACAGAVVVVWCLSAFVFVGKGTAAPFDPPRKLVVVGPYRFVRNPMYVGAGMALIGASIVFGSPILLAYVGVLWILIHALVVFYEEPTLTRSFGADYETYRARVRRWLPRLTPGA